LERDELLGKHPIRKWERKLILSVDYGLEAIYAGVLQEASHLTYGVESADTYTWIENAPEAVFRECPRIKKAKELAPSHISSLSRATRSSLTSP